MTKRAKDRIAISVVVSCFALWSAIIVRAVVGHLKWPPDPPAPPMPIEQGMVNSNTWAVTVMNTPAAQDPCDSSFRNGVFWGALAAFKGATNLNDAEIQAYILERKAGQMLDDHEAALKKVRTP